MNPVDSKIVSVKIPVKMHRKFVELCRTENRSLSATIRLIMVAYMKQRGVKDIGEDMPPPGRQSAESLDNSSSPPGGQEEAGDEVKEESDPEGDGKENAESDDTAGDGETEIDEDI